MLNKYNNVLHPSFPIASSALIGWEILIGLRTKHTCYYYSTSRYNPCDRPAARLIVSCR